jgi:hypothetical protein
VSDIWFTVLRWLILIGVAVGLIAVPTIYVNNRIDSAHTAGIAEGRAACVADYAAEALKAKKLSDARILEEANKALEAQAKAEAADKNATKLQGKLNEALKKDPPTVATGCVLSAATTSILREFALTGGSTDAGGEPISSPLYPKVPTHPAIPGQGNPRHGG